MRDNASHFDDHFVRGHVARMVGEDMGAFTVGKVREGGGEAGEGHRVMAPEVRAKIDAKWAEWMAPKGFASYGDFRAAVAAHFYNR